MNDARFQVGDKVRSHNYYGTNTYGIVEVVHDKDLLVEADDGKIFLFLKSRTRKVSDYEFYKDRQNDKARRFGES